MSAPCWYASERDSGLDMPQTTQSPGKHYLEWRSFSLEASDCRNRCVTPAGELECRHTAWHVQTTKEFQRRGIEWHVNLPELRGPREVACYRPVAY